MSVTVHGGVSPAPARHDPAEQDVPQQASTGLRGVELTLGYHGVQVVASASIRMLNGHVTALVGPNGSGKSTVLRALARLHRPDSGQIVLGDGSSALDLTAKDFARRVTLLAQSRPTPNGICVRDVVEYGRHPYRGRWRREDPEGAAAVAWAMEVTGVDGMAERGVDELSGGELQRVWLATSLAQRTDVLLLDEPTTFLDLRYQIEILDLIRDLADEHKVAVGVVLHDLNQAATVSDHVALLHKGEVQAAGAPAEVFTGPLLSKVYGLRIDVHPDPQTGHVSTKPVGRHTHRLRDAALDTDVH
ncbi:ABC transporter ATP-binding protein [Phytoactinopolyspora endophytica]|uniref:ABC transporter ATP-binding protein n=1 Tax=Phytoactinopolyspora endophytica TaxID=1642495 RepID=UPI00101BCC61|nr:ABC transporter ATP-binding protein [Phytoactinopolyspora endophytica]